MAWHTANLPKISIDDTPVLLDEEVVPDDSESQAFVGILLLPTDESVTDVGDPATDAIAGETSVDTDDVSALPAIIDIDGTSLSTADAIVGTEDGDVILLEAGGVVLGLAGDDVIESANGGATMIGGSGYDLLSSLAGGDTMVGGEDPDLFLLWFETMTAPVRIVDFDASDVLTLVGDVTSVSTDGRTLLVDGRPTAIFSTADAAALAAAWVV